MRQLARAVSALRGRGQHTSRRRVPRQQFPFVIEVEYAKALLGVVVNMRRAMAPLLSELPGLLQRGDTRRVHYLIDQLRHHLRVLAPQAIAGFARRVAEHQRAQLARQVRAALGVDLEHLGMLAPVRTPHTDAIDPLKAFVAENVALIKSLASRPADEVEQIIMRAFGSGQRHEELAVEIEERFKVAESRARLIARDQIGKLNAQVAHAANAELGLNQWRWVSMRDGAVRPHHAQWDQASRAPNPPYDEHRHPPERPGVEVACRCYEDPVFDDILEELER
jgi:SPP1 gp7 family putative phage head morphogenesis protein